MKELHSCSDFYLEKLLIRNKVVGDDALGVPFVE